MTRRCWHLLPRMLASLIMMLAVLLLLSEAAKSEATIHCDAREFYHELCVERQEELLFNINLQDQIQINALVRLLSNKQFNIAGIYNAACKWMITERRATEILQAVKDRKDLETLLIGPSCLSLAIISARKALPQMWPPHGFPLLTFGFWPTGIDTNDVKDILSEALGRPEWWQASDLVEDVDWAKMDDLRFWRMIPPVYTAHNKSIQSYLKRALVQTSDPPTGQSLEELLMKSIRMPKYDDEWRPILSDQSLDVDAILDKFSHLKDPWSVKVLDILNRMRSKEWEKGRFSRDILNSGLVQFASWGNHTIDMTTATNDIFELFTVALYNMVPSLDEEEMFKRALASFLDANQDFSKVRPLLLSQISGVIDWKLGGNFLSRYIDKFLINPNALSALLDDQLKASRNLQVHQYNLQFHARPLRGQFESKEKIPSTFLDPYTNSLYQEWTRDQNNWPGMIIAHNRMQDKLRRMFKPSENKDGTYDPNVDKAYSKDLWNLTFYSIRFDVEHGIPSRTIPSLCFLKAVLSYHENISMFHFEEDWTRFKNEIGKGCILPESKEERSRYQSALRGAKGAFFEGFISFPIYDAQLLQALIRGNGSGGAEAETQEGGGRGKTISDLINSVISPSFETGMIGKNDNDKAEEAIDKVKDATDDCSLQ